MRHINLLKVLLAAFVVAIFASNALAADPNGTWTWTVTTQSGQEFDLAVELKQDGEKLTGLFLLPFGDEGIEIKEGTFKDDEVAFSVEIERGGNVRKMNFKGKVEGDTIKGTSERERDGEVRSRDWEATREKK